MTVNNFEEQFNQLMAMGYDPMMARNALEASGGDVETAVEIIMADDTKEINNSPSRTVAPTTSTARSGTFSATPAPTGTMPFEGKTAKEVVKQWTQQLSPEVRATAKDAGKTAKSVWSAAVSKMKQADEKYQISLAAKGAITQCDQKMKFFDEKHDWSKKANKTANEANVAFNRTVESAKKSLAEQRQDESYTGRQTTIELS
jgi:hypothetical protein